MGKEDTRNELVSCAFPFITFSEQGNVEVAYEVFIGVSFHYLKPAIEHCKPC